MNVTLKLGICSVRNLKNISQEYQEVHEPVVANNATASTVMFIGLGPHNGAGTHVLYVGVTFTGNSPYRSEIPAVSSRSLDRHNLFQIAKVGPLGPSAVGIFGFLKGVLEGIHEMGGSKSRAILSDSFRILKFEAN